MCNFRIGQKVVCINDDRTPPAGHQVLSPMILPDVGKVYTVRNVLPGHVSGVPCIALDEIPDQQVDVLVHGVLRIGDLVFTAEAFRPVVDKKTDISIFKAMLTPSKQGVPA